MEKILFLGIAKSKGRVRATETIHTNKVILEIDCLAVMRAMILLSNQPKRYSKIRNIIIFAGWQSGHAATCKAVYAGSIPASASK